MKDEKDCISTEEIIQKLEVLRRYLEKQNAEAKAHNEKEFTDTFIP